MFAGFTPNKSKALVVEATANRILRQNLISSNIANIDTPFYKARDVEFSEVLLRKKNEIYNKNSQNNNEFELSKTHENHFDAIDIFPKAQNATIFFRDGHLSRNDANSVDLDIETSELSKNSIMIQALDTASKKLGGIFTSVIDASGRISS